MSRVVPFYALLSYHVITSHGLDPALATTPAQQVPSQQVLGIAPQGITQTTAVQSVPADNPMNLASLPVETASATLSASQQGQQVVALPVPQVGAGMVMPPSATQPTVQSATQAVQTALQPVQPVAAVASASPGITVASSATQSRVQAAPLPAMPAAMQPAAVAAPLSIGAAQPQVSVAPATQVVAPAASLVPSVTAASARTSAAAAPPPSNAANAAANAANAAAQAASAAAIAANTAARAASTANTAAIAAATTAGASAVTPAGNPVAAAAALPFSEAAQPDAKIPSVDSLLTWRWLVARLLQLVAGLTFASVIKGVCIAGNVLVQISPFPQATRWQTRGCTGDSDAAPYLSIAFSGCQWCFYGLFAWLVTSRSGFLVLVQSNILGAVLGPYYVSTFFKNCRRDESIAALQKYISAIMALVFLQVCGMCVLPMERALFLTGLVSSFCSFIGASSILVTVPIVLRSKDSRSIPGPFAVANLCSALSWVLCGYILEDPMVMMPNLFATCCSGLVVALKVMYPSSDHDDEHGKAEKGVKKDVLLMPAKKDALPKPAKTDASIYVSKLGKSSLGNPTEFTPIKPVTDSFGTTSLANKWAGTLLAAVATGSDGTGGTC